MTNELNIKTSFIEWTDKWGIEVSEDFIIAYREGKLHQAFAGFLEELLNSINQNKLNISMIGILYDDLKRHYQGEGKEYCLGLLQGYVIGKTNGVQGYTFTDEFKEL